METKRAGRRRHRGRPRKYHHRYGFPTSRERDIRRRLIEASLTIEAPKSFIDEIKECGTRVARNTNSGIKLITKRCCHDFCPDCHRHRQIAEGDLVSRDFATVAKDEILFVTILLEPRARLSTAADASRPTEFRAMKGIVESIRTHKARYRRTLKAVRPDKVIQWGWIEVAEHVVLSKPHVNAFVEEWCAHEGVATQDVVTEDGRSLILHLHLLVHMRKQGRALAAGEITRVLRNIYPHTRQVHAKALYSNQSKEDAMDKVVGYCHKHAIGLSDLTTAELGYLIHIDRHALRFPIRWGLGRRPKEKSQERPQSAIGPDEYPTPQEMNIVATPNQEGAKTTPEDVPLPVIHRRRRKRRRFWGK